MIHKDLFQLSLIKGDSENFTLESRSYEIQRRFNKYYT